ncbi:DUF3052 domain-containing protein [Ohtaekwangia kribbensis]|jgi:hypothetical protein|uniref:DUF3052 domain-containing protein n=1 Tax=Ohtaekwangia kribbensis TaxID=688913 RepID=A0ABW3JYZ6_9BACT
MAGYSATPLVKKLGIKPGFCMFVQKQPEGYWTWLEPLPERVAIRQTLTGELDFIHVFVKERSVFEKEFVRSKKHLKKDGMLWVSWPKKSSGVQTDLDENIIRAVGLEAGLVDVKVCAVDDVWSGLKFVFRIKDR